MVEKAFTQLNAWGGEKDVIRTTRPSSWLLYLLVLVCSVPSYAQFSGDVQGVISNPSGAAINGVSVGLRNLDTGVTATTTSSNSGNYRFSSLSPGRYVIKADASGFQSKEVNFTLSTGELQGINFTRGFEFPIGDRHGRSPGARR